jgi:hypothetical protein
MAEVFDDAIAALRQHHETRAAGEPAAARWSGAVAEVMRVHFNRVCRATYGTTPRDWRATRVRTA